MAVSSLFNGFGRIVWGAVSEQLGRINTFRLLLASQLIVFGMLMTEHNPWVFAVLVCYVLSCFGGGFAIMPSMVIDVYGPKRMSRVYGVILTAWSAAGIFGPMIVVGPQGRLSRSRGRLLVSARYPRARGRLHLQLSRQRRPVHTAAHPPPGLRRGAAPDVRPRNSPRGKRLSRLCFPQTISLHNSKYRLPTMLEQRETRAAHTEKISIKVTAELKAVGTATDRESSDFRQFPAHSRQIDLQSETVNEDYDAIC